MGKSHLKAKSLYSGSCIIIPTKHGKSEAILNPFWDILGASVMEYSVDTDMFGTFSKEIEREGSEQECARRKCEWSLKMLGPKVELILASEGSFGPHPLIPFMPINHEILYFIDRKRDFHLHISLLNEKTNFQMQEISSFEELQLFAIKANFPSHALMLRPESRDNNSIIFKGINTKEGLEQAFKESLKLSCNGKIWVETDMRAHMNPLRMSNISELAKKMAMRLSESCPVCATPGWGQVRVIKGLICKECGLKTSMIKHEIFGCVKCKYEEVKERADGVKYADQWQCQCCNP